MSRHTNKSTRKDIRFNNELLDLIGRVLGEGEKLSPFVHEACKALAVDRLKTLEIANTEKLCGHCHEVNPKHSSM